MKFLDLFTPIEKGNYALTDEAIYKSIKYGKEFIPIWGGSKQHTAQDRMVSIEGRTKKGELIKKFQGEGIIISLDGSSGCMTYKDNNEKFALNHHAGFFKVKQEAENIIHPMYFAIFYQNQLEELSVSDGSKTVTPKQIYKTDFDIPEYEEQEKILNATMPLFTLQKKLNVVMNTINKIKSMTLSQSYLNYQEKDVPVADVLEPISGNRGLTEQEIYNKSILHGKRFTVLSGSTKEETKLGEIPLCEINGNKLNVFEDQEGILIIRKGKAGNAYHVPHGNYTVNEDAYIITIKKDISFKINAKWVLNTLRNDFFEYSSNADNGTWNKTKFFEEVRLDIPEIDEQLSIITNYDKVEKIESKITHLLAQINKLLSKHIISV